MTRRYLQKLMEACGQRNALGAFFVISAMESSFFPVPIDLAMVPLGIAQRSRMWLVVLVGSLGSIFGALLGYLVGFAFFSTVGTWLIGIYGLENEVEMFRSIFLENGAVAIVIAGLSPIPFKVATILSGSMGMNLIFFLLVSLAVRTLRFTLMGLIIFAFGPALQRFMEARFAVFVGLLILTMAAGFLITPYML